MCQVKGGLEGAGRLWGKVGQDVPGGGDCVNQVPGRKLAWCFLEIKGNTVQLEIRW